MDRSKHALIVLALAVGCGGRVGAGQTNPPDASDAATEAPPDTALPADCWVFKDGVCPHGDVPCREVGDSQCFRRCTNDADCIDPAFSKCVAPKVWEYMDYCHRAMFKVCMTADMVSCRNPP